MCPNHPSKSVIGKLFKNETLKYFIRIVYKTCTSPRFPLFDKRYQINLLDIYTKILLLYVPKPDLTQQTPVYTLLLHQTHVVVRSHFCVPYETCTLGNRYNLVSLHSAALLLYMMIDQGVLNE